MTLHPALERQLPCGADLLREVEQVANYLADLTRDAGCFVSVARNFRSGGAER